MVKAADMKTTTPIINTASQTELKQQLVTDIYAQMREQEPQILKRNAEIDKRYLALYSDGLTAGLPKKAGFDATEYNFVRRVPEIMSAQLMGRDFNFNSTYDKDDLSVYDLPSGEDPQTQETRKDQAELLNGRKKADADLRVQTCRAIIEDNGGFSLFHAGAKIGSYSGITVYKRWADDEAKRYNIVLLENPNNFWRKWSDSDFREWDWDAYTYQISETSAYKKYGEYLKEGEQFGVAKPGGNAWQQAAAEDINNIPQKMVWVVDLTGTVDSWKANAGGKLEKVKRGKEEDMNVLIVGGKVCHVRNDKLPKYTVINNLEEPLNPWGVSDVSNDALSINSTIVQMAQSWVTLAYKSLFYKMKFKNFTALNIPKNIDMEVQGFPMDADQDIELIQQPQSFGEFERIIDWLINSFVRVTRIGRVMFDDPTSTSNSNQAMMTSMKGLIDTIEDKQSRWTPALVEMFTDALMAVSKYDKALKEAIDNDDGWRIRVEYPSILRREDNTYQQMWNNIWNSGVISPETYMDKMGVDDPSEELDRIKDAMNDPIRAAMMGKSLGLLAQQRIQEAMMQTEMPLPPEGEALPGGDVATPTLTPDQNTGEQPVSQPGSGAPGVSPQGAINQVAQQTGRL